MAQRGACFCLEGERTVTGVLGFWAEGGAWLPRTSAGSGSLTQPPFQEIGSLLHLHPPKTASKAPGQRFTPAPHQPTGRFPRRGAGVGTVSGNVDTTASPAEGSERSTRLSCSLASTPPGDRPDISSSADRKPRHREGRPGPGFGAGSGGPVGTGGPGRGQGWLTLPGLTGTRCGSSGGHSTTSTDQEGRAVADLTRDTSRSPGRGPQGQARWRGQWAGLWDSPWGAEGSKLAQQEARPLGT